MRESVVHLEKRFGDDNALKGSMLSAPPVVALASFIYTAVFAALATLVGARFLAVIVERAGQSVSSMPFHPGPPGRGAAR